MYSKVKLAGHPVHAMLVAFPVALYTAALVCFVVCAVRPDPFWFKVGWYANAAGVVTALVAAVPGFIDWAVGVPRGTPAKATGLAHMVCHLGALFLFALNLLVMRTELRTDAPQVGVALLLPILGFALTLAGGFLGWKMVQTHHVGVDLTPEQERLEPRSSETPARGERQPRADRPVDRPADRSIGGPVYRH